MITTIQLFKLTFPNLPFFLFMQRFKGMVGDCKSVLDVGCGGHSPAAFLKLNYMVGLDAYKPKITEAKKNKTHHKYYLADAKNIEKLFKVKEFDVVVALDVIEHFKKEEGKKLLKSMEKIAKKRVVIFTPNGFLPQKSDGKNFEEHLSGWTANELNRLGFKTYGFYGLKGLRSNDYGLRFKPKFFWGIISMFSEVYVWSRPCRATALLCVKEI